MPSVYTLTASLLREEGERGGGLLERGVIREGDLLERGFIKNFNLQTGGLLELLRNVIYRVDFEPPKNCSYFGPIFSAIENSWPSISLGSFGNK